MQAQDKPNSFVLYCIVQCSPLKSTCKLFEKVWRNVSYVFSMFILFRRDSESGPLWFSESGPLWLIKFVLDIWCEKYVHNAKTELSIYPYRKFQINDLRKKRCWSTSLFEERDNWRITRIGLIILIVYAQLGFFRGRRYFCSKCCQKPKIILLILM